MPNHNGWYFTEETLNNAVILAKLIMQTYNIDINHVIRHFDITGKLCPGIVGWNTGKLYDAKTGKPTNNFNNENEWIRFKNRLIE